MTRPGCKHIHSERQRRFFGAVAGGRATKPTTMTKKEAKHHIRMGEREKGVRKALRRAVRGK